MCFADNDEATASGSRTGGADVLSVLGPCQGVIALEGEGNYIRRATLALLRRRFGNEAGAMLDLASLPQNQVPSQKDLALAKKLAYFLLYCLRKDIKSYACDIKGWHASPVFAAVIGAYKFGPCSNSTYYLAQMLHSLGFPGYWLRPQGHTSLALRLGSGALLIDTSYNLVVPLASIADLSKNRVGLEKWYAVRDNVWIDKLPLDSLTCSYGGYEIPSGFAASQYAAPHFELEGLPLTLPANASFHLDYTGNDGFLLGTFVFRYDALPEAFTHFYIGRLHEISVTTYVKAKDTLCAGCELPKVNVELLAAPANAIVSLEKKTAPLRQGVAIEVPLGLLLTSAGGDGLMTYALSIKHDAIHDFYYKHKQLLFPYERYRDARVKLELIDATGKVVQDRTFSCVNDVVRLTGKVQGEHLPMKARFTLLRATPVTDIVFSPMEPRTSMSLMQDPDTGVSEYFRDDQPFRFFRGMVRPRPAIVAPMGAHVVFSSVTRATGPTIIRVSYRLSALAFPFHLFTDRSVYAACACVDRMVFHGKGEPVGPFSVKAYRATSGATAEPKRALFALHVADAFGEPVDAVSIDFEGLYETVFPLVPLYTKDQSRPRLLGSVHPNENGVANFMSERHNAPPHKVALTLPDGTSRKVVVETGHD